MRVFTIGHGVRPAEELVACLAAARVETLVDVRRFPGSRRNPQFGADALADALAAAGIRYVHAVELGGRRSDEPGEERYPCVRVAAFRSYVARMATAAWQAALGGALEHAAPCLMCAETDWRRCHRRLISDYLVAHGHEVVHLIRPHERQPHRLLDDAEARGGRRYVCGQLVA